MADDHSKDELPAQAENVTFEDLLNAYTLIIFRAGRDGLVNTPAPVDEKQALLAYVAKIEARQITPEMMTIYEIYLRDEQRGDPELRDMRFAGAASAFFTRFLRTINPDWK